MGIALRTWGPVLAATALALAADVLAQRLRFPSLAATFVAVFAFGIAGAASARLSSSPPRARVAALGGSALFALLSFGWLRAQPNIAPADAAIAALLSFAFASLSSILGVARQVRRARTR